MLNILMKEDLNLNENLNEFLKEWEYHTSVLDSYEIIFMYGFTADPNISKYMVVMDYANKDLMKECWNEDSSKRPSSGEVLQIIDKWIFHPDNDEINEELKSNIMEFINAPIGRKKLNEILENEDSQASVKTNEMLVSEDLDGYIIKDLGTLDIKIDEN
ncbi:kinase-like domain-containing protein [Rhizophagus irregularis DAOM 181602=DAOM 197198]|nr:kinase-like domain-containing protein [Rhizophagus irregularis DAOM 181602=DAOM 197198]